MQRILSPLGIEVKTAAMLGLELPEVVEDGDTFEANAALKARSACRVTGLPVAERSPEIIKTRIAFFTHPGLKCFEHAVQLFGTVLVYRGNDLDGGSAGEKQFDQTFTIMHAGGGGQILFDQRRK